MKEVEIEQAFVELYKVLKFEGVASSGGQAKAMIDDGLVQVNGEVETRKRRKLVVGDTIEFQSDTFKITQK
ncbi:MAG: ribosome-associated protein [Patiriisocius sp.]|jgi:ribosome-associated protein